MTATVWLSAALAALLAITGAAVGGYNYGVDVQKTRDEAAKIPAYDDLLTKLDKANNSARTAYETQVKNAERYAADLGEARANIQVVTKEIPKYVAANPAPRSCDISDWLFVAYNQAAAETRKPPVRSD